jgi:hypothetical protein
MDAINRFRNTVRISKFIDKHLESLARDVEGTQTTGAAFNTLVVDLRKLYPEEDGDALARMLVTEQCRAAFIKMKDEAEPKYYGLRD